MSAPTLNSADEKREQYRALKIEDFWSRVKTPDGCRLYYGAKESNGYGYVKNPLGDVPKYLTAHKLAWILTHGPVPDGLQVLHKCDVRACCNPDHLFLGDIAANMQDMNRKGRSGTNGARNMHAKLTDKDVLDIRARYKQPSRNVTNAKELAAEYGVKPMHIQQIVRRAYWKHLP